MFLAIQKHDIKHSSCISNLAPKHFSPWCLRQISGLHWSCQCWMTSSLITRAAILNVPNIVIGHFILYLFIPLPDWCILTSMRNILLIVSFKTQMEHLHHDTKPWWYCPYINKAKKINMLTSKIYDVPINSEVLFFSKSLRSRKEFFLNPTSKFIKRTSTDKI